VPQLEARRAFGPQLTDAQLTDALRATIGTPEGMYWRRKMTAHLRRQGYQVAACTVDRLMRDEGLAAALDRGSVLLVMSLQVTTLLFALPIYGRLTRHPVTRREWMWAVLLAGALAVAIAGRGAGGRPGAGIAANLVCGGRRDGSAVGVGFAGRPDLVESSGRGGAAGGSGWFVVGGVRGTDQGRRRRGRTGAGQLWQTPELYAWVFSGVAGMIFHQLAYRAGALTASLPTIIIAKPVVGAVLGITVLEETLNADGTEWFVLAAAVVVVTSRRWAWLAVRPPPWRPVRGVT
jgi:HTH-like domain